MKILVIGDVHQKVDLLNRALTHEKDVDLTVFMGDYCDDFDDNYMEVTTMAEFLKDSLQNPKRIHLMGNHDINYALPLGTSMCSGYTSWKHELYNSILTAEDWKKMQFFFHIKDYWFSHAGVTRHWFSHPMLGISAELIDKKIAETIPLLVSGEDNCITAVDGYRGGRHRKGGLLWNHFTNSDYFDNITQIIGHTPLPRVEVKRRVNSNLINVDTHLQQFIILDTEAHNWQIIDNK